MTPNQLRTLGRIIDNQAQLWSRERDFIENMDGQRDSEITEKQATWMFNIGQRIGNVEPSRCDEDRYHSSEDEYDE